MHKIVELPKLEVNKAGGNGHKLSLRQRIVRRLLKDVPLDELHFGDHSVVVSATGIAMDNQKITNMAAPTVSGDGARKDEVDTKADDSVVIKKDGSVAFTGDQPMGGNKLTGLGTPVAGGDAATKDHVDSVVQGLDWQASVKDELADPPAEPATGDRYIVIATASGDWAEHENDIAEWNGTSWDLTAPDTGFAVWIEDVGRQKNYNGAAWVAFGTTVDHGSLLGKEDDDHAQYLNETRHDARNVNTHADITSPGADIEDAVTKKHTQGTDTALGAMAADVNMNTHKITGLAAPAAVNDAIRADANLRAPDAALLEGVSKATVQDHTPKAHLLGAHGADTLANLNAKVSDATLDDASAARTPSSHDKSKHSDIDQSLKTTDNVAFVQVTVGDLVLKNGYRFTEHQKYGVCLKSPKGELYKLLVERC